MKKTALIIGGGPAGLTAAYEFLKEENIQPIVVEMSNFWGGISRTENHNGNRIDIGGHRFFSKSDIVMKWWQNILPIETENARLQLMYQNQTKTVDVEFKEEKNYNNVMLIRSRKSRIYYNKKFFNYPISLNIETIKNLGFLNSVLISLSYIKSVFFPIKNQITLEDFFINRFGFRLYKTFFKDYTEKIWGVPCSEISSDWGAQRIKGLSITKTVLSAIKKSLNLTSKGINQKDTETSLIEYFLYPKYGPGQMWENVAKEIENKNGILKQNSKVVNLNFNGNQLVSAIIKNNISQKTETIKFDYCISTMPVNELINSFDKKVPENVKTVSDGLLYRDFITVGILVDKMKQELDDNWIYIQENYVKVGRLQIFNNWSPFMVADLSKTWLGLEYFCDVNDDIWSMDDDSIISLAISELVELDFIDNKKNVIDSKVIRVPKAYPAYFGTYDQFDVIKDYTNKIENLFLIGRNGMHKYNNQDHSMLTAIKTVEIIENNTNDKKSIWKINTEDQYHETK